MAVSSVPITLVNDSEETWQAECRQCGLAAVHPDREAAHFAVMDHMAETGHFGELSVTGHFQVWRPDAADRAAFRPHRMTIGIGVLPDGGFSCGDGFG